MMEANMRRASILRAVVCLAVSTVVALVLLGTKHPRGILAKVYAQDGCSLRTLHGSYGAAADGLVTTGPPPVNISATIPIAVMAVQTYDGAGNFSGSNTTNLGGLVFTSTASGTYTVNADCTGSATSNLSSGEVIHFSFVIVDHARQILSVGTDPGVVSFARAIKVGELED
jgi:hypothetical protein